MVNYLAIFTILSYGTTVENVESSDVIVKVPEHLASKFLLCQRNVNLSDGQTVRCRLQDTMNIQICGENISLFKEKGFKRAVAVMHYFFQMMKMSFFKIKIVILSDFPNDLDYFHRGNRISEDGTASLTWSLAFVNSHRQYLIDSLKRLRKHQQFVQETTFYTMTIPSTELLQKSMVSVRRKIPEPYSAIDITVACRTQFDAETIVLITIFLFLIYFGPIILCNFVSRMIICVIFGSIAAFIILSFFLMRDISRTTLGRIGVAGAVFFGSLGFLSEGFFRSFIPWFATAVRTDRSLQIGGVATGIAVVATFSFFNIQKYFMMLSYGILRLLQIGVLIIALTGNAAACVSCTVIPAMLYLLTASIRYGLQKNYGSARDSFPSYVYKEAVVKKQSCETFSGTPDEKMRKYELEGAIHTRKYLEKLGGEIRSNVSVVTRTNDPNTIAHWAGVTS